MSPQKADTIIQFGTLHPFLKTKFRVGSCRGPLNFKPAENVFHRSDIPEEKHARKLQVQKSCERKTLLKGNRESWTSSVHLNSQRCKDRSRVNSENDHGQRYQYNYRAEVLAPKQPAPAPKLGKFQVTTLSAEETESRRERSRTYPHPKRTAELPIHPNLEHKVEWNMSTFVEPRQRLVSTAPPLGQRPATLFAEKTGMLKGYIGPEERARQAREEIRELKKIGKLWRLNEPEPVELPSTHNRLAKDPIRRIRTFKHSGTYQYRESEGCHMWSDTGSYERDSIGDVMRTHRCY
ncbi:unnamed protein product [Chrysoparadoxa australica]